MNLQPIPGHELKREGDIIWIARTGLAGVYAPLMSQPLHRLRLSDDAQPVRAGRAGPFHIPGPGPEQRVLVRPYARGGWLRHLLPEGTFTLSRPLAELGVSARARELGLPVPDMLGVSAERSRTGLWRAAAWTLLLPGAAPLPDALRERIGNPNGIRSLLEETADVLKRFHDSGLLHGDLNVNNVVLAGGKIHLVDLDRARTVPTISVSPSARRAQLRRLYRSFAKLGLIPGTFPDIDFEFLAVRYFGPEMHPRQLRSFLRACRRTVFWHRLLWR